MKLSRVKMLALAGLFLSPAISWAAPGDGLYGTDHDFASGLGAQTTGNSIQVFGLTPATGQFPLWTQFDFKVKYTKRPYFLLPDDKIAVKSGLTYYKPDGTGVPFVYAEEWRRFTSTWRQKRRSRR